VLETAEIGQKLSKRDFQDAVPELRTELLRLQYELHEADFPVVVLLAGDDQIGCREALIRFNEWLDPRFLRMASFGIEHVEDREYPHFWRYWRSLPARGRIGVFLSAWTLQALAEQIRRSKPDPLLLERQVRHITGFERALADDGALLVKFWLHLPKGKHRKRLRAAREDPAAAWQITEVDRLVHDRYDELLPCAEELLRLTSANHASWRIVESSDPRYRDVMVGRSLAVALREHLGARAALRSRAATPEVRPTDGGEKTVLDTVDLSASLDPEKYEKHLPRWQGRLAEAAREAFARKVASVLVFQGWDAAGKGGTVRRLAVAIPPALLRIRPIAAPNDEERAHHYLWRFWRQVPREGHMTIFDRSWYERVLVERVEGYAHPAEWRRAYDEINDFEEQLSERGIVVCKFWLHIDPDEQLRRFRERETTPFKQHKIGPEDYRNRARWSDYEQAVNEMVARTHTSYAPWHLVAANDKRHARVEVIRTVCKRLERALEGGKS
jgi:polyphosphate:AMP phosphotransferase